jgi:hypothetical protein
MLLSRLQHLLGGIYDVRIAHDVYDFLVTDRGRLPYAARAGVAEEELIVAQPADGSDEVVMSLYLDPALLERLAREDPLRRLHAGNLADCWTALEGVSHFLYLAWNAGHDRPVSLLELEMQAEVDKYVVSYWLLRRQFPQRFPAELRRMLFERTRIDPRLTHGRAGMYREASRYAEKFCRRLEQSLARARGGAAADGGGGAVLAELRRFYRLTHARKRAHIERQSGS